MVEKHAFQRSVFVVIVGLDRQRLLVCFFVCGGISIDEKGGSSRRTIPITVVSTKSLSESDRVNDLYVDKHLECLFGLEVCAARKLSIGKDGHMLFGSTVFWNISNHLQI